MTNKKTPHRFKNISPPEFHNLTFIDQFIIALVTGPAGTCIHWETSNEAGFEDLDLAATARIKTKCYQKAVKRKAAVLNLKLKKGKCEYYYQT